MKKKNGKMKITKKQLITIEKAKNRRADIESGANRNHHRVHKSKKDYNRQKEKQVNWD